MEVIKRKKFKRRMKKNKKVEDETMAIWVLKFWMNLWVFI